MNRERVRVAVTGIGAITALGPDVAALGRGLVEGRSALGELTLFDATGFRSRVVGQAPDPLPSPSLSSWPGGRADRADASKTISRADRFGLAAAFEAMGQSGLDAHQRAGAAVIFGTGTGGAAITEQYLIEVGHGGDWPPVQWLAPHQPASVTDLVARHLGLHGPRTTIMTACSSSAIAIGDAADRIRLGQVKVALAGGAEGLCRLTCAGFGSLRATSPAPCRPFDVERDGISLGEGAAALVLEEWQHARARGATILAEFGGWGVTADAYHMTAPHPDGDGAARAMRGALLDAGLTPDDIDYVNAHGTGTRHNDSAETSALKAVLGERAPTVPISSIKSMVGHTLGAAGAIEAVASVISLGAGLIPPTVNLEHPDPAFGLDYVPGSARRQPLRALLSNSFAFGGNNTSLVFVRA
jgi:3-oxoacyl-[acyl-carrier-protein] synthase II